MSETAAGGTGGLAATGAGQPAGPSGGQGGAGGRPARGPARPEGRSGAQAGVRAAGNRPVALQLYTLRDELTGDRAGVLRRLAGFGYRTAEADDVVTDPDAVPA